MTYCETESELQASGAIEGHCPHLSTCNQKSCRLVTFLETLEKNSHLTIETVDDIRQNQILADLEAKRRG